MFNRRKNEEKLTYFFMLCILYVLEQDQLNTGCSSLNELELFLLKKKKYCDFLHGFQKKNHEFKWS